MNREQQDLSWACLPKEARKQIKNLYYHIGTGIYIQTCLESVFNKHNLTSDTEPEEMVHINRRTLIDRYASYSKESDNAKNNEPYLQFCEGRLNALANLFGNKCLPDKIQDTGFGGMSLTPPVCKLDVETNKEPSVQVEPKFKVGDKVRKRGWDKDTTISRVEWHGTWKTFVYHFKEQEYGFNCHKENDLTLVSKRAKFPNFSIGDKVQLQYDWSKLFKGTLLTIKDIPTIDRDDTFMYSFEETDEYIRESMLEPYTEPETKDNMEEKELNLAELLKGCDETAFYSPTFGVVLLKAITENDNKPLFWDFGVMTSYTYADGRIYSDSVPTIFPSRALYEKYPLDALQAWKEWSESRKPKRWHPKNGEGFWCISPILKPHYYAESDPEFDWESDLNHFETEEMCKQAAEAVRETLMKFHEQKQK